MFAIVPQNGQKMLTMNAVILAWGTHCEGMLGMANVESKSS